VQSTIDRRPAAYPKLRTTQTSKPYSLAPIVPVDLNERPYAQHGKSGGVEHATLVEIGHGEINVVEHAVPQ
jgi:hypothetical protein